uniref:Toxin S5C1 n=1 Tax=Dendroaspis jamesoni kaimosae TaxID=8619 RepID=3SP1_DENJA|nr:RecName: Full=Toxin S5C1 [Dendroaspis jamesoni kaimosae]
RICYNHLGTKPPTTECTQEDSCYKNIWRNITFDNIRRGCGCFTPRGDMPGPYCCESDKCNL